MSFKCNTSGLQGVTDGEHDVRELIEYYINSRTSSSLYRYREGSTRIGQTTPDRSTIKDRWEPYIPEIDSYIRYKRNGVSDSLMPPGYFTTFEKMAQVTGGTNGQTVTIASNSSGQLTYTNSGATYILSRTGFNNASIAPKFIYLVVQSSGGHGGYGQNVASIVQEVQGGGGGAGGFCALCLSLEKFLCGNILTPNKTFATIQLGGQSLERTVADISGDTPIDGKDSSIKLLNSSYNIVCTGGRGGIRGARGYGGNCTYNGENLSMMDTMDSILALIRNDDIIAIYPGTGCSGGDPSTPSTDPESYVSSGTVMAESCSSDISNLTCPGYSAGRVLTTNNGRCGWGGGASFFSNGIHGLNDQVDNLVSKTSSGQYYGAGGGGGAQFLLFLGNNADDRFMGTCGGYSILRIYY